MDWAQESVFSSGYLLKIEDGQDNDGKIFRLERGNKVHFLQGTSLAYKDVTIFTDAPENSQTCNEFRPLKWYNAGKLGDKSSVLATVELKYPGSFRYYFTYPGNEKAGCGYFIVDPKLEVGNDNSYLPLDSISMQSVLVKSLGSFSSWEKRLEPTMQSGYNALHFTPLQLLGGSNSSYSIGDQLSLNPKISEGESKKVAIEDIKMFVEKLRTQWKMVSLVDVVWNHTSMDSDWLKSHQYCAYNLKNTPHLRPAYIFDRALFYFSVMITKGALARFTDGKVKNESDLNVIKDMLMRTIIPPLMLWEFFQCNIELEIENFKKVIQSNNLPEKLSEPGNCKIGIVQDPDFKRFGCTIDMKLAVNQFYYAFDNNAEKGLEAFEKTIVWLNDSQRTNIENDVSAAVESCINTIRYERLDEKGPKLGKVTLTHPLVKKYFYHTYPDTTVENDEQMIMNDPNKAQDIMAHNGWVMGHNALENFAHYPHMVYFKRQLVCWGDSVKLRYGNCRDDCPYLWDKMKEYTESMARTFHGLRIDNCHSTPIHVAEYLLKAARAVNPELYIFAELFTGDEHTDNLFVNRLGINSLVRECLNAWDSHEQGRLIYLYGGEPIASFNKSAIPLLRPSRAHAVFYDVTHDNECMMKKRSIYDVVPSTALVSMSCCAIGSNRGHDELVPHHIHVVNEERFYREWNENSESDRFVNFNSGMVKLKKCLNHWHYQMAARGFTQVFVDQRSEDIVAVTRHNPENHHSYIIVAHNSFTEGKNTSHSEPLNIEGRITKVVVESRPTIISKKTEEFTKSFSKSEQYINGVDSFTLDFCKDINVDESKCVTVECQNESRTTMVTFNEQFTPGSIVMFEVEPFDDIKNYVNQISEMTTGFDRIIDKMSHNTLNYVLFCCENEQQTYNFSYQNYNVDDWRSLVYCGLMGIALPMQSIKSNNDLGHPICNNLRKGDWLLRYISSRLERHEDTAVLGDWMDIKFRLISKLPRFLIPTYFEKVISSVTNKLLNVCWKKMSLFVKEGGPFVKALSLASVALCAEVKGAMLPFVPADKLKVNKIEKLPSIAAGLPHFSAGSMRCWGRDTFISMRGLLMLTGRMHEARQIILSFAGCLRHGLIPNLLAEGKNPRYNCRDAVWFWLQSIQDYCNMSESYDILKAEVYQIFPTDLSPPQLTVTSAKKFPLCEVMQQALNAHANDIIFRERNAGTELDRNMSDEGFEVKVTLDIPTGMVSGGSEHNCGTWMDKMGESELAGNKGTPATPRNGSAIEIVALCKSLTRWLHVVRKEGHFPYEGIKYRNHLGKLAKCTWKEWGDRIKKNFRKKFYVDPTDTSEHAHKKGIYKDTDGASNPWCDYQLRPNFAVAMVYAPELFKDEEALAALDIAQEKLLGPLGIKTLDPDDMQYRGDYDNTLDNDDAAVAKGFNYHQGPEWLWPVGYFLRAKLYFSLKSKKKGRKQQTIEFIQSYLVNVQQQLESSDWFGLPELTNSDGKHCKDSCPIQAWSHSSFLELLFDLQKL